MTPIGNRALKAAPLHGQNPYAVVSRPLDLSAMIKAKPQAAPICKSYQHRDIFIDDETEAL
jgi:hypothetical protein